MNLQKEGFLSNYLNKIQNTTCDWHFF